MSANVRARSVGLAVALVLATVASARPASAQKSSSSTSASAQDNYDVLYKRYLDDARRSPMTGSGWIGSLMLDPHARRTNDLLTVSIVENLSASGSADANTSKTTKTDLEMPSPLSKAVSKVLPTTSDSEFKGAGGTSRTTTMTAIMTARVNEVLPNGDLVVEGVREIVINDERQLVVLTGVVRQADIASGNVVSSNAVGQLRIQCIGHGLTKDNLSPGWLVRALNKVF